MKKSLIALAVSSAVVAPASVQAAEVYGSINTTFESASSDGNAGGASSMIFNTTTDNGSGGLSDTFESRFGVTGSEDLGNGLTAGYTFEFGIGTSAFGAGGATSEDQNVNTRLSNVSLSGDFGEVKVGTQWGVLYSYAGWNHYRTDGHGGATHYYMMNGGNGAAFGTSDDPSGLRIDNAITYTYGGGGYSSDPFTFSVQVRSDDTSADANNDGDFTDAGDTNDDETIDAIILGAQSTLPGTGVTINGTYYSESNTSGAEPSMLTIGGRWSSGPFYVGGTYFSGDRDTTTGTITSYNGGSINVDDSPSAINVLGGMDFGSGYSGYLGVGSGDADADSGSVGDMTTFFLQGQKTFSSRTKIYGEFETVEFDGGSGPDGQEQVLAVGIKHSF